MTIKEIRTKAGLTQKAFAEKYEIPKRTLEDWDAERRIPAPYIIKLLERVVSEDYKETEQ